jgi:hypothetical protein
MLIGTGIVMEDLKADPLYDGKEPTLKDLARFTLDQKYLNENDAIKYVNGMKGDYGTGVCCLVCIYNATGVNLIHFNKKSIHDWNGHIWKYAPDEIIKNGQWSVFLHAHSSDISGILNGSEAAVIYDADDEYHKKVDLKIFMGWSAPVNPTEHNKVYVDYYHSDWEDLGVFGDILRHKSSLYSERTGDSSGIEITGSIGDSYSPIATFIVKRE